MQAKCGREDIKIRREGEEMGVSHSSLVIVMLILIASAKARAPEGPI